MKNRYILGCVLVVQVLCATFFVSQIAVSVLGLPYAPLSWQLIELIEIGAAVGLILGVIFGAIALRRAFQRTAEAEAALQRAQSAFRDLLNQNFTEWGLTPAERDVAMFAIKGYSTADIAAMRDVSEGTVKAQTNAIYRKAGVTGRPQLLSLFIDDLIENDVT